MEHPLNKAQYAVFKSGDENNPHQYFTDNARVLEWAYDEANKRGIWDLVKNMPIDDQMRILGHTYIKVDPLYWACIAIHEMSELIAMHPEGKKAARLGELLEGLQDYIVNNGSDDELRSAYLNSSEANRATKESV